KPAAVESRLTGDQIGCAVTRMISPKRAFAQTVFSSQPRTLTLLSGWIVSGLGCFLAILASAADSETPHLWQPVRDDVYLQEVGRKVVSDQPLNAVAAFARSVYVGSDKGLYRLNEDKLEPVRETGEPIRRLVVARDALWAMTGRGLHRLQDGTWKKISDEPVADVTGHLGEVMAASGTHLWRVRGDKLEALSMNEAPFAIGRVISHCETLYVQGGDRLTFVNGQTFGGFDVYSFAADQGWDWGDLPSRTVRDV